MDEAQAIIERLGMRAHPEGGYYTETWRADVERGGRAVGTAIYYLLQAGERSHWHRIDAAEMWHYYAGAPLRLSIAPGSGSETGTVHVLGSDLGQGARPQLMVPAGDWQAAESSGDWSLVGCTVSPGFRFEGFELAEPGWEPG